MKKAISLLLLLPLFSMAQKQGTASFVDVKFGFKDIKLEGNVEDLQKVISIEKVDSSDGQDMYKVIDDDYLNVGDCKLKSIYVSSFQGQVSDILINTDDRTSTSCMLETLRELFGKGYQPNHFM
jgi:hypothetical protein